MYFRRFLVVVAVVAVLLGLRLGNNGLLALDYGGKLTVYKKGGEVITYEDKFPVLNRWNCIGERLDIDGDMGTASEIMRKLKTTELWREYYEDLVVIYGYSNKLEKYETVKNEKVNIMIAVGRGVAVGYPILMGSY